MLHHSSEYTPHYEYLKTVTYLSNHHYIMFSTDKLIIFSREVLQQLQVSEIITLFFFFSRVSETSQVILQQWLPPREVALLWYFVKKNTSDLNQRLQTGTQQDGQRYFKGIHLYLQETLFFQMMVKDKYIIGCSSLQLIIWDVQYERNIILDQLEQNEILSINAIFSVELQNPIKNVKFTPDVRFICTLHANKESELKIWDFEAIRAFQQDGDIQALPQTILNHQDSIQSYKLRETQRISPSPLPTPISIITQTSQNILTVWQEQPFLPPNSNESHKITFFKLHTIYLQNITSFCFIYEYNRPSPYPWNGASVPSDSLGIQDVEDASVDYILVHQEDELQIMKLEMLRNYSLQTNVSAVHQFTNSILMKSVRKMIYANQIFENEVEKLEIIGFDRLWNLTKIVVNLNDPMDFRVHTSDKFTFEDIEFFSYDPLTDTVCLINKLNLLCYFKASNARIVSQQYEVRQMDDYSTWKMEVDRNKYKSMFHFKGIVLLFPKTLEEILLLQLNRKTLMARPIKISNFIQRLDKEAVQFEQIVLLHQTQLQEHKYQMYFLVQRKTDIITLRITVSEIIFEDKQQQDNLQIEIANRISLNFKAQRIIFDTHMNDSTSYGIFALDNKTFKYFNIYQGKLIDRLRIDKQFQIMEAGHLQCEPLIFYLVGQQNQIDFHNISGDFLVRFNLAQFLVRVDSSLYDVSKLTMHIQPLYSDAFLLSIENYVIVVQLAFDKQTQQYRFAVLDNDHGTRSELYYMRLSRRSNPKQYQFYQMKNGNVLMRTGQTIKIINCSLEPQLMDPDKADFLPKTINMRLLQRTARTTFHDPSFIQELLYNGKFTLVNYFYHLMALKLQLNGSLGARFAIPLTELAQAYVDLLPKDFQETPKWLEIDQRIQSDIGKLQQQKREILVCDSNLGEMQALQKILQEEENLDFMCLDDGKIRSLLSILNYSVWASQNKRSLDFYAEMFMFYVHLMRNQPLQGKKSVSLYSKEVVWALHSNQKDTIWQECIERQSTEGQDHLWWNLLRRYCTVLWYDTLDPIKQKIEKVALASYKLNQDPFASLLYYVMVGKRNVVAMLFKKEMVQKQEYKNTYEFLMKDFNEPRWKSAASKNAYALISKKRYADACAFFLLGGHLSDAVNVLAVYLEDIQLALLCAKLNEAGKKEQPVTRKLIQDYFIKTGETMNDIWLLHIGYYLLGQHVDSVNVLYRQPKQSNDNIEYDQMGRQICLSWPRSYEPQMSCFHPSAALLAVKLEDSMLVKREIQMAKEKAELARRPKEEDIFASFYDDPTPVQEQNIEPIVIKKIEKNINILREQSVEYYFSTQQPILGILIQRSLQNDDNDYEKQNTQDSSYVKGLQKLQVQVYALDSILGKEHLTGYKRLIRRMNEFVSFLNINSEEMFELCSQVISSVRSPARTLLFELAWTKQILSEQKSLQRIEKQIRDIQSLAQEMQQLIYLICYSYPMNAQTKEFYGTLLQSIWEIDITLHNLITTQEFIALSNIDRSLLTQMNIVKLLTYITAMILSLELGLWIYAQDLLKKIELFCNELFQKKNAKLGYDNLREDFYEQIVQRIRVCFNVTKTKTLKAARCKDLISDAFPQDKYDKQAIQANLFQEAQKKKHQFKEEQIESDNLISSPLKQAEVSPSRNVCAELILTNILKTQIIKYFLSISKSYFKNNRDKLNLHQLSYANIFKLSEQYSYNRYYQTLFTLTTIKDYQVEHNILEDISNISKNELAYKDSKYFTQLPQLINLSVFNFLSVKVHVDVCADLLVLQLCKSAFRYPKSSFDERNIIDYRNKLFRQGVEIYRIRQDTVRSFTFNNSLGAKHEGIILLNKQLKKINILHNLLNRNRNQDGYTLVEEETLFSDDVTSTVRDDQLLNKPLIVRLACSLIADNDRFADKNCVLQKSSSQHRNVIQEGQVKSKSQSPMTSEYSHYSQIVAHPYQPHFAAGTKGGIDILSFRSQQIVQDFSSNAREPVTQLRFNNQGDMILGVDSGNNSFVWKIHPGAKSKLPVFQLSHKSKPASGMCFVNEGSVVASIYNSSNRPQMSIFDLLLPQSKNVISTEQFTGNDILFSSLTNTLLICNQKKGIVNCYDIRKNQVYQNIEVPFCEIKEMALNHYQNKVLLGCSDGNLKIFSINQLEQQADIKLFRPEKKTPTITNICVTYDLAMISASDGTIVVGYLNA